MNNSLPEPSRGLSRRKFLAATSSAALLFTLGGLRGLAWSAPIELGALPYAEMPSSPSFQPRPSAFITASTTRAT